MTENLVSGPAQQNKSQIGCIATDLSLWPPSCSRCCWRMFFNPWQKNDSGQLSPFLLIHSCEIIWNEGDQQQHVDVNVKADECIVLSCIFWEAVIYSCFTSKNQFLTTAMHEFHQSCFPPSPVISSSIQTDNETLTARSACLLST